jgi:DNA invertase Pin-like site-specific DNA recombinase
MLPEPLSASSAVVSSGNSKPDRNTKNFHLGCPSLERPLFGYGYLEGKLQGSRQANRHPTQPSSRFYSSPRLISDGNSSDLTGGGTYTIGELPFSHDFIELFQKTKSNILAICKPLYEKGMSLREIEQATGIPKSTIRETFTKFKFQRRGFDSQSKDRRIGKPGKRPGHTPFGYAYLDGQLLIDPKEQKIVRLLIELHRSGLSYLAIASQLNEMKIPTRSKKTWQRCVVRSIILRQKQTGDGEANTTYFKNKRTKNLKKEKKP